MADLEGQDTRHDAQPHQYAASDTVTSYAAPQPEAEQASRNAVPMFAPAGPSRRRSLLLPSQHLPPCRKPRHRRR